VALLKEMAKKRSGLVAVAIGGRIILTSLSLWWNNQLSSIINDINADAPMQQSKIAAALATILLSAVVAYIGGVCLAWTSETMAHDLRMGYANHFATLHIGEIEKLNAREQVSKLQNETEDALNYIRGNLFAIADDVVRFVGTSVWLMRINPTLTLLANMPVVFLMWYTAYSSGTMEKTARQTGQENANLNGLADTLIAVFPIMRLFDASALIQGKYNAALGRWESAGIKEDRKRAILMSLSGFLSLAPLMLLFLIGGTQVFQGTLTLGTLYIFVNLSGNISGVMMNLPGTIAGFRRFAANMERLRPTVKLTARGGYK